MTQTQGFTLIELLIVIATLGILIAILIPALMGARTKANDTAAASVARQIATATAAMQVSDPTNTPATCTYTAPLTVVQSGAEQTNVASGVPVSNVTCIKNTTTNFLDITVWYTGGSQPTVVMSVQQ